MNIPGTGLKLKLRGIDRDDVLPGRAVFLKQVHGTEVLFEPDQSDEGDGMIFRRGKGFPGLRAADCLPVFAVWDSFTGAAHAGWKGLSGGVVENLIHSVSEPLRFLILGPCICQDCYMVGDQVRMAVSAGDPAGSSGHPENRVDLRGSALRRVEQSVNCDFKVIDIKDCTLESETLYSYRKNGTARRNILWLAENAGDSHIQHPYHE